jgi:hypothetical protein
MKLLYRYDSGAYYQPLKWLVPILDGQDIDYETGNILQLIQSN